MSKRAPMTAKEQRTGPRRTAAALDKLRTLFPEAAGFALEGLQSALASVSVNLAYLMDSRLREIFSEPAKSRAYDLDGIIWAFLEAFSAELKEGKYKD